MKKSEKINQKNKITSYFSCSAFNSESHIINKSTKTVINSIKSEDDDCIIIDESESRQDIVEKIESITEANIDKCDNEDSKFAQSNDDDLFEGKNDNIISSDDDDFLSKSLEAIESQNDLTAITNNIEIDSPTVFFLSMLEEFLDKPFLHYLFNVSDIELIRTFYNLPSVEYKKLFVRLYWLQWKWYKASDAVLKYLKCDIKQSYTCQNIIETLQKNNFFSSGAQVMDFDDWTSVLLRPDLIKICNHFKIATANSDKPMLINRLKKFCSTKSTIFNFNSGDKKSMEKNVLKMINDNFGDCIKITDRAKHMFDSLHLIMYLGMNPSIMREKKLNLLLMNVQNGKETFPAMEVQLDTLECVFPSKEYFEEYEEAHSLYEQILKLTSSPPCDHEEVVKISKICHKNYIEIFKKSAKNHWIPSVWLHRFTAGYCYIKGLELSVGSLKALKSNKSLSEALEILTTMLEQTHFRQHKRALWYNEKALILHTRLREFEKTARLLISALQQTDITNDAKAPLVDRARRLALQKNIKLPSDVSKQLLELSEEPEVNFPYIEVSANSTDSNYPGKKSQYMFRDVITGDRIYSNVEQYALMHYIQNTEYNRGEHWEGRIINSIFILLFWDIIYSPVDAVKGVFISRFQEAPLDIFTDKFYSNRESSIKSRISDLESGWSTIEDIIEFMQDIYASRKECEVSLFHSGIEWSQISEIAHCLGRNGLLCLCKRLSSMYFYAQSGFPDLTIWNAQTNKIKFVEVKGDGDRLSHKQIQWMNYLIQNGIDAEVCYVHKGSNVRKFVQKRSQPESSNSVVKKKRAAKKIDVEKTEGSSSIHISQKKKLKDLVDVKSSQSPIRNTRKNKLKDVANAKSSQSPIRNSLKKKSKDVDNVKSLSSSSHDPSMLTPIKINSPYGKKSPSSNGSPQIDCYLRSPIKQSKGGIGYFQSPKKDSPNCRRKLSLSLTKRKVFERDT